MAEEEKTKLEESQNILDTVITRRGRAGRAADLGTKGYLTAHMIVSGTSALVLRYTCGLGRLVFATYLRGLLAELLSREHRGPQI